MKTSKRTLSNPVIIPYSTSIGFIFRLPRDPCQMNPMQRTVWSIEPTFRALGCHTILLSWYQQGMTLYCLAADVGAIKASLHPGRRSELSAQNWLLPHQSAHHHLLTLQPSHHLPLSTQQQLQHQSAWLPLSTCRLFLSQSAHWL